MIIAIDATEINFKNANSSFLLEALKVIATENSNHQFIFIIHQANSLEFPKLANVFFEKINAKASIFNKSWSTLQLARIIKKQKVDLLVLFNSVNLLIRSVPQCVIVTGARSLKTSSLRKAQKIIAFSSFAKNLISKQLKKETNKIEVVPAAIGKSFGTIGVRRKNEIKEKYSEGKEFFLFVGEIKEERDLIFMLKSFSQFKKRQQSNLQLLIVGDKNLKFDKNLESYKYRNDIKWILDIEEEELAAITIAAYAAVQPFRDTQSFLPALQAMQSAVPVIAMCDGVVQEIAKEAGLYINDETPAALAEKMMLIYTNESLRMQLVEKGKIIATEFNIAQTAASLWQSIKKSVN